MLSICPIYKKYHQKQLKFDLKHLIESKFIEHDKNNSNLTMIKEEIMLLNSFARVIKEFPYFEDIAYEELSSNII